WRTGDLQSKWACLPLTARWGSPMHRRCSPTCSSEASRGKICFRLLLFLCFALGVAGLLLSQKDNDNYSKQREEMVRTQIATVRWSGSQAVQDAASSFCACLARNIRLRRP